VGKAAGVFNPEKLLWVNTTHLKEKTGEGLAALLIPFFELMGYKIEADEKLSKMAETLKERVKTLKEMAEQAEFYIKEDVDYDEKAATKFLTKDNVDLFKALINRLEEIDPFTAESIHKAFEELMTKMDLKLGKMAQPVRVAITGGTVSPGIFETLEAMGKEKTVSRLKKALAFITAT
jgi:glutamyl-tRNA synthetase